MDECYDFKFGEFCLQKAKHIHRYQISHTTKADVYESFNEIYVSLIQYHIYQSEGIFVHENGLNIPQCVEEGSLKKALNWLNKEKNND